MPYNIEEANKAHYAIKEFYEKQATFHASMNTIIMVMAGIMPTLTPEVKEKFERLLRPFYAIQNNPFALTKSEADIINGTYDTPEEKTKAVAFGIRLVEKKMGAIPSTFFSSLMECMGAHSTISELLLSLPKLQQNEINDRFQPSGMLSNTIKPMQHIPRYAMLLKPLATFSEQQSDLVILKNNIIPTLENFTAYSNDHLDTITLKNKAITLLITAKHAKLEKNLTSARKESIEVIDKAIQDIQAIALPDTYEKREQFIASLNHILSTTTSRSDLGKTYQDLSESMKSFILKKPIAKQPVFVQTPTVQIQSENINLTTENAIKKIEATLGKEWGHEKTNNDALNATVLFQKRVNNQVTNSFVVKSTSISTNDKDTETYRAMITAFKSTHPEKTLRMRAADEAELQKVKAICSEIQSKDVTFKYTLTIHEKINISPSTTITEPKQNAPQITNDIPEAPTTSWKDAVLPEEHTFTNANVEIPAAEPRQETALPVISPLPTDIIGQEITDIPAVNSLADLAKIKESIVASSDVNFVITQIKVLEAAAKQNALFKDGISDFHIDEIEKKAEELVASNPKTSLKDALTTLKSTLDGNEDAAKKSKESSNKGGIFSYLKNKITSGYRSVKNSYKQMSTAQKVGFWIGATVAVAAFAGLIVGLTVITGGAAPAIGAGTMAGVFGGKYVIAGVCALVSVAGAAFSVTRIKKNPAHDKKLDLSTGVIDEVQSDDKHNSDSDINKRLGANQPTSAASKKRDSTLTTHSNTSSAPAAHPASASSAPTVVNSADDDEGEEKHPTLKK
ncbi:MAG: hypothetical protein WAW86_03535 [Gammaproteobacteria bacterium]